MIDGLEIADAVFMPRVNNDQKSFETDENISLRLLTQINVSIERVCSAGFIRSAKRENIGGGRVKRSVCLVSLDFFPNRLVAGRVDRSHLNNVMNR